MMDNMNKQVLDLMEIDNSMVEYGYYSIMQDGVLDEVLKDGCVVYTSTESNEAEIIIEFNIVLDATEDEDKSATIVATTDIRKI